jgi:hypothetical protein
MTHAQLATDLERERISHPDRLEAERHRPGGIARAPGLHPAYTPITEELAARNLARLAEVIHDPAPTEGSK